MNNADKIIKRCRALALAGMIGITSLGSSLPAFAAGPGDDSSRVSEISTGGPGDPGNTNSSNSTTNTGNSNNSNSNNNTNNSKIQTIQTIPIHHPTILPQIPMPGKR